MKNCFGTLIFFFALVTAMSCSSKTETTTQQAPAPVAVNIDTVEEGPAVYYDEYPATINALNQVDIHAQVSGYITGIHFNDGSHVVKGQRLYSIDQQQYAGAYNQSVANLDVAKANLDKAQKNADRYLELQKNDAIAKQTVDNALADLQAARMEVKAAEANVSTVQTNLRYTTIYAPFSGTIGISMVKLGSAVSPGSTILNTISSDNPVALDFAVDEKEIARFVQLQQQGTRPADSIFTILLPGGGLYDQNGKISLIDRAVDPQTGTIRARLEFANPQNILKPGMTCNIRVKSNGTQNAILIPTKAITEQMGEYFVFVLGDSSKAVQTRIAIGMRISDKTIVKSGLNIGDRIVTDGVQKVRDGAKVALAADTSKKL